MKKEHAHGRNTTLLALKMKGPQAEQCGQSLESGKGKEMNSFLEPSEKERSPVNPLILGQWDPSGLLTYRTAW